MMTPEEIRNYMDTTDRAFNSLNMEVETCQATTFPESFPWSSWYQLFNEWKEFYEENDGFVTSLFAALAHDTVRASDIVTKTDVYVATLGVMRGQYIAACGQASETPLPVMEGVTDVLNDHRRVTNLVDPFIPSSNTTGMVVGGLFGLALLGLIASRK